MGKPFGYATLLQPEAMGFPYRLNTRDSECPLCGVERTLSDCIATSQFDPEQTHDA